MQMLCAGGMPLLVDATRPPDAHNPNGYFEFDAVKRAASDIAWVKAAVGKAVKVVHVLLPHLPPGYVYRVVFTHRDPHEVLASQRAMLDATGHRGADLPPERLAEVFARQVRNTLDWAARQPHVSLLEVQHRELIHDPAGQAKRINRFLGGALDESAMAAVVDPSLYRQRQADSAPSRKDTR
jgi:hypothetical protein